MDNKIVILLGHSSVGKDTIAKLLNRKGYEYVISTTTRPIREGESERNPYIFTNNEHFENLIKNNELIEYRKYNASNGETWYYGVENDEIDKNKSYVAVLDPVGLDGFKIYSPNNVISFFLDANDEIRKQRCILRGDFNEVEWEHRKESDNNMFNENFIKENIDYIINAEKEEDKILEEILLKIEEKRQDYFKNTLKDSLELS